MKYIFFLLLFLSCDKPAVDPHRYEPSGHYRVTVSDDTFEWVFEDGKLTEHRSDGGGCGQYMYISNEFFIASPHYRALFGEIEPTTNGGFVFTTDSLTFEARKP